MQVSIDVRNVEDEPEFPNDTPFGIMVPMFPA